MIKRVIRLTCILLILVACDQDEAEQPIKCDNYYLSEETSSTGVVINYYYNANGLLSSWVIHDPKFGDYSYQFIYDNNRLKSVRSVDGEYRLDLYYDTQGKLIAGFKDTGTYSDSIVLAYDNANRIVKWSNYGGFPVRVQKYTEMEYDGSNTSISRTINIVNPSQPDTVTVKYSYDNKSRPHPPEYYTYKIFQGEKTSVNNVVSSEFTSKYTSKDVILSKYQYNSDGYPLSKNQNYGYQETYSYSCDPVFQ